jgi:hypothetical protein
MIDFDAVIRHFGPKAVETLNGELDFDESRVRALADQELSTRKDDVRTWLQSYGVLRVRDIGPRLDGIMTAIFEWADSRDLQRDLATVDALAMAHAELMAVVSQAYTAPGEKRRDFTSFASKMLWLCYPDSVPIVDSYATRTLWVISKLELSMIPLAHNHTTYRQFVHVWRELYARHDATIEALNHKGYPYRVRVFDRILWLIGQPQYGNA